MKLSDEKETPMMETPYVIVPMAGYGRRFRDEGYADEKPLIEVGGRRLLEWSLLPIPVAWRRQMIAIVRDSQTRLQDELQDWLWSDGSSDCDIECITIHGPTQGAACTVLAAAVGLPPDAPVLVMNADQYFRLGRRIIPMIDPPAIRPDLAAFEIDGLNGLYNFAMADGWDGFILTFSGKGPAWSYAVTNGTNRVVYVIEKKEVSPYATVGAYWWRRAADLVRSICAMIAVGQKTNAEFFLSPAYNFLPLSEKNVQIVPVEEFHGLGTPEDVRKFEQLIQTGWKP